MDTFRKDQIKALQWLSSALGTLNVKTDFSLESIKAIEEFLAKEIIDGKARIGGYLESGLGSKLFAISTYLGETLIRHVKGARWEYDEADPEAEINMAVRFTEDSVCWPAQKVLKRVMNGNEDNIYSYSVILLKLCKESNPEIVLEKPMDTILPTLSKPWWQFWA